MICLSWCKDQQLKSYIDEALSFLYPTRVDPPSLVEICVYKIRRHIQESGIAQRVDEVPGHLKQRYPLLSPLSLWFQEGPRLVLPMIKNYFYYYNVIPKVTNVKILQKKKSIPHVVAL